MAERQGSCNATVKNVYGLDAKAYQIKTSIRTLVSKYLHMISGGMIPNQTQVYEIA